MKLVLGNGSGIYFWTDVWIGEQSLKSLFPALFKLSRNKTAVVRDMVTSDGAWDFSFARALKENELLEVIHLLQEIGEPNTNLSGENLVEDSRQWSYGYGKAFSVANAYSSLETDGLLSFPDKQLL